jgi:hypothetical protein
MLHQVSSAGANACINAACFSCVVGCSCALL